MAMPVQREASAEEILLAAPGSEINLHAVLVAILRGKRIILICAFLCGVAALIWVMRQKTTYEADVELLPPAAARTTGAAALASGQAGDPGLNALGVAIQGKNQVDSFSVILQAWPLQDSMVKRFDLVNAYKVPNATVARAILASRVKVIATREGFIRLGLTDTDPQRAAVLANGYVDEAREFLKGLALSEASQRRVFYEGQLAATKTDLAKAEENFRRLQQSSGIISVDTQAQQLIGEAAGLRSQITAKEVQLQSLRGYSTDANPQVQIAESELSALRGQLSQVENRGQGGITGKGLSSVPGAQLDFIRATRELRYQEGLYDLMVRSYEGSKLDEARDAPTIQVIEPALVPLIKSGPHRIKTVATGIAAGLFIGLAIVLFRYWKEKGAADKWLEIKQALDWRV